MFTTTIPCPQHNRPGRNQARELFSIRTGWPLPAPCADARCRRQREEMAVGTDTATTTAFVCWRFFTRCRHLAHVPTVPVNNRQSLTLFSVVVWAELQQFLRYMLSISFFPICLHEERQRKKNLLCSNIFFHKISFLHRYTLAEKHQVG
jgi:hypothetical protein